MIRTYTHPTGPFQAAEWDGTREAFADITELAGEEPERSGDVLYVRVGPDQVLPLPLGHWLRREVFTGPDGEPVVERAVTASGIAGRWDAVSG